MPDSEETGADPRNPNVALDERLADSSDMRDAAWTERFLAIVPDARLAFEQAILTGPDGFPYVAVRRDGPATAGWGTLRERVVGITDLGYGVALEPGESGVRWIFQFGDLANLRMFGQFTESPGWSRPDPRGSEFFADNDQGEFTEVGAPNVEYLPLFIRRPLGRFLERVGLSDPRVALVYRSHARQRLLALETDDPRILRLATWFLPPGYAWMHLGDPEGVRRAGAPLLAEADVADGSN